MNLFWNGPSSSAISIIWSKAASSAMASAIRFFQWSQYEIEKKWIEVRMNTPCTLHCTIEMCARWSDGFWMYDNCPWQSQICIWCWSVAWVPFSFVFMIWQYLICPNGVQIVNEPLLQKGRREIKQKIMSIYFCLYKFEEKEVK